MRAALLAFFLFAAAPEAMAQCSMCKETLKEAEAAPLSRGFKYSIYGMLAMPFLLGAGIVIMIRRSDKAREEQDRPRI